jgi:hypothetical protein
MDITARPLRDVLTYLQGQVAEGRLGLTDGLLTDATLTGFLTTLPGRRITLDAPRFTLVEDVSPQVLTVTGTVSARWPVSLFGAEAFEVDTCVLRISRPAADAPAAVTLDVDATLQVATLAFPVTGRAVAGGVLRCALRPGDHPSLDLAAVVGELSGAAAEVALPADATFAKRIALGGVDLSVGFGRPPLTSLAVTLNADTQWSIVEGSFVLQSIGVTFTASHTAPPVGPSTVTYGVALRASLLLRRVFTVTSSVDSDGPWEITVVPADGTLPSLADLAGLVGGSDLRESVRSGLDAIGLGAPAIDGVRIAFDPFARRLLYAGVAGHITLAGARFDLYLRLPPLQFAGRIARGEKLRLKPLFAHFFGSDGGMPDIEITELGLSATPSTGAYRLALTVEDGKFTLGPLGLRQLSIDIAKQPTGFSGSIGGGLTLGGAELVIEAARPEAAGPWVFTGGTGPGQQVRIATLHADLAASFGDFTLPKVLDGLVIDELSIRFDTAGNGTFTCHTRFPVNGVDLDLTVFVDVRSRTGAPADIVVSGKLSVGDLRFTVDFSRTQAQWALLATYRATGAARSITISRLVAAVSADVAALVPADLEIELDDAMVAVTRTAAGTTVLIGLDLGAKLDLSGLPLVGQVLPAGQTASVENLRLLVATGALSRAEVTAVNALLPDAIAKLPVPTDPPAAGTADVAVARGPSVSARLNLGGTPQTLAMPIAGGVGSGAGGDRPATPTAPVAVASSDTAKWFTLQKTFGPLYLSRIGARYEDAVLWILLDAALSALGLTVSLDGLALGSPVKRFDPRFDLRGLGIDYRNPAIEIGAAFLRTTVTDDRGRSYDEYDGAAVLKAKALTLSAIGSYAYLDGHPSLFIYAVLDYPIGGPSFFFVTGLAAGFGYNRALIVPPVDGIAQFPLVSEATKKSAAPTGKPDNPAQRVAAELATLRSAIPPSVGANFLAVGIRFTSFQMLDSFALLTVSFGQRFEVNLLGLSTMVVPPAVPGDAVVPPLAEIQLALRASFVPDEGFLGVAAQLTPASYVLSRDCHLTGGFAFSCWFPGTGAPVPNAGDFVLTLGGYHPGFAVPAHYPRVPRLGINWKVSDRLAVKGESYFALTPSMLMCGVLLDATWNSGDLRAWFHAGADFLIAWKPYHYDAHAYASLQVSYRFELFGTQEIRLSASADLHLWGPPFSGSARVSLSVVGFDIAFGAAARATPDPIDWGQFTKSFLPAPAVAGGTAACCGISLRDGLVRKAPDTGTATAPVDLGVVNPKQFVLVTDSVIPSTAATAGTPIPLGDLALSPVGVAPMAVRAGTLTASHTIVIRRDGVAAEQHFSFTPVIKRLPAALWGERLAPSLGDADFVERALSGFEIRPNADTEPTAGTLVSRDDWRFADAPVMPTYGWETRPTGPIGGEPASAPTIRATIGTDSTVAARARLLDVLGITAPVDVDASIADMYGTRRT